jgi:hypothetical protein
VKTLHLHHIFANWRICCCHALYLVLELLSWRDFTSLPQIHPYIMQAIIGAPISFSSTTINSWACTCIMWLQDNMRVDAKFQSYQVLKS